MTPESLQSIAFRWFEAFNSKKIEKLLTLYENDSQHYSPKLKIHQPETNGLIIGVGAMRIWGQDAFDKFPTLKYELTSLTANSDRVFMEYVRKVDGENDLLVAEVLEIKDGKIINSRVYHG
jgi:hypothetical protein